MIRNIIYTKRAAAQIRIAANYLSENFSEQSKENFILKIEKVETKMSNYPETGSLTRSKGVRYLHIDKDRILFYRFDQNMVLVAAYFDSRQDPGKRPF